MAKNLPDFNRLVLACLEGEKEHSGALWRREGWAFMVRHDGPHTVANGWSRSHYDAACVAIDADLAGVRRWAYLDDIEPLMTEVEE